LLSLPLLSKCRQNWAPLVKGCGQKCGHQRSRAAVDAFDGWCWSVRLKRRFPSWVCLPIRFCLAWRTSPKVGVRAAGTSRSISRGSTHFLAINVSSMCPQGQKNRNTPLFIRGGGRARPVGRGVLLVDRWRSFLIINLIFESPGSIRDPSAKEMRAHVRILNASQ